MTDSARHSERLSALWRVLPVVTVAVTGAGLLAAGLALGATEIIAAGVAVIVQAPVLYVRDRLPLFTLVTVVAIDLGSAVATAGETSAGMLAVMIAAYSVRRHKAARVAYFWLAGGVLVSTALVAIALTGSATIPDGLEVWVAPLRAIMAFGVPLLLAEIAEGRFRLLSALRERAEIADRERELRAAEAVQQERSQIARELHDIAAHHLSGIIVGAQAASALVSSDPDDARQYIRRVSRDAQITLTNLRLTVGLLRVQQDGDRSPLPAIAQIPELVADLQSRGSNIELVQSGTPLPLGPVAEVTAYRMVQESLANARTHAPGAACSVDIRYSENGARLTVANSPADGPSATFSGGGYGLIAMEERAALVNGRVQHGPTADGGWRNELFIPAPDTTEAETPETETDGSP